jgi:hypothetical protein
VTEQAEVSGPAEPDDAGLAPGEDAALPDVRRGPRRPVSPRRAFWLSFVLFFCLFTLWAVGNPLSAAPDEPSHATKAASVVRGDLVGEPVAGEPDGFGAVYVPNLIWQSQGWPMCYDFKPNVSASCEPEEPTDPGRIVYAVTTASNYNPLYYSVTGLPSLLPLGEEMILLMRLVSAALCAFAMAWAVRSLAELREMSWPVLGLAAATTPMAVFLASAISPAGPETCVAIALWTALLVTVHRPDPARVRSRMAGIAVLASVLVNLRGMSPMFLAIIVATVVASAPWANTWTTLRDRRSWPWLGLVGVASCAALMWMRTAGALPTSTVKYPKWGFARAAVISVHETPVYLRNMVGQFGWVDTELPLAVIVEWLGVIGVMAIAAIVRGTVRERLALLGLGVVTVGLPIVIHASQAQYIGIVWQGRYFLPAAVGIPLVAGFVLRGQETAPRPAHRFLPWVLGALLLTQLIALAVNLHRYAVGADGPWWPLPADAWQPPIAIPVLLLACAAVLAFLFRLLTGIGKEATFGSAAGAATVTATAASEPAGAALPTVATTDEPHGAAVAAGATTDEPAGAAVAAGATTDEPAGATAPTVAAAGEPTPATAGEGLAGP